eukprot:m.54378 g.54378  ORF g.54378 m.54378 type:complete len:577 (+) comp13619_c0_seq1:109-1839(+)
MAASSSECTGCQALQQEVVRLKQQLAIANSRPAPNPYRHQHLTDLAAKLGTFEVSHDQHTSGLLELEKYAGAVATQVTGKHHFRTLYLANSVINVLFECTASVMGADWRPTAWQVSEETVQLLNAYVGRKVESLLKSFKHKQNRARGNLDNFGSWLTTLLSSRPVDAAQAWKQCPAFVTYMLRRYIGLKAAANDAAPGQLEQRVASHIEALAKEPIAKLVVQAGVLLERSGSEPLSDAAAWAALCNALASSPSANGSSTTTTKTHDANHTPAQGPFPPPAPPTTNAHNAWQSMTSSHQPPEPLVLDQRLLDLPLATTHHGHEHGTHHGQHSTAKRAKSVDGDDGASTSKRPLCNQVSDPSVTNAQDTTVARPITLHEVTPPAHPLPRVDPYVICKLLLRALEPTTPHVIDMVCHWWLGSPGWQDAFSGPIIEALQQGNRPSAFQEQKVAKIASDWLPADVNERTSMRLQAAVSKAHADRLGCTQEEAVHQLGRLCGAADAILALFRCCDPTLTAITVQNMTDNASDTVKAIATEMLAQLEQDRLTGYLSHSRPLQVLRAACPQLEHLPLERLSSSQ